MNNIALPLLLFAPLLVPEQWQLKTMMWLTIVVELLAAITADSAANAEQRMYGKPHAKRTHSSGQTLSRTISLRPQIAK